MYKYIYIYTHTYIYTHDYGWMDTYIHTYIHRHRHIDTNGLSIIKVSVILKKKFFKLLWPILNTKCNLVMRYVI